MELKEISQEIREILKQKRNDLRLSFIEHKHIYYMMDEDGKIRSNFPSVTKIIKKFHKPFDAQGISLSMAKGDIVEQQRLLAEWKLSGELSVNLGSRSHYELEKELIKRCDNYKEVRQPEFVINEEQRIKSDNMISAGIKFLDIMKERGAESLDTELVMGHPNEGFVGQCDNAWIMMNKEKNDFGFVLSDWKTNAPKNFRVFPYNNKLYPPFSDYADNALGQYYLQIPLYGRLLVKMLEGTKFEKNKFLGGVLILLKEDGEYEEFKAPQYIISTMLSMDLKPFLK